MIPSPPTSCQLPLQRCGWPSATPNNAKHTTRVTSTWLNVSHFQALCSSHCPPGTGWRAIDLWVLCFSNAAGEGLLHLTGLLNCSRQLSLDNKSASKLVIRKRHWWAPGRNRTMKNGDATAARGRRDYLLMLIGLWKHACTWKPIWCVRTFVLQMQKNLLKATGKHIFP